MVRIFYLIQSYNPIRMSSRLRFHIIHRVKRMFVKLFDYKATLVTRAEILNS